jgi:uncharacterized protein YutE (UPF0331/DUF86 family)
LLLEKIDNPDPPLEIVEESLPNELEEFRELGLVKDGIYKKTEFCIENIIDICSIINSDINAGMPSDEDNILDNLEKNKVISKNLVKALKEMKGFRNILVHKYGRIDDAMAFESINSGIKDFHNFIKEIDKFMLKLNKVINKKNKVGKINKQLK